jgi:hypothetical protein
VRRLEVLILLTQAEQYRMLKVRRQNHILISRLARHLNTQIPGCQRDECEFGRSSWACVLVDEMLRDVSINGVDGFSETAGTLYMLPGKSGQRRAERSDGRVCGTDENGLVVKLSQ